MMPSVYWPPIFVWLNSVFDIFRSLSLDRAPRKNNDPKRGINFDHLGLLVGPWVSRIGIAAGSQPVPKAYRWQFCVTKNAFIDPTRGMKNFCSHLLGVGYGWLGHPWQQLPVVRFLGQQHFSWSRDHIYWPHERNGWNLVQNDLRWPLIPKI